MSSPMDKAIAGMAGQAVSEKKPPDFFPGWFNRRGTTEVREAVRILDLASFPVNFLRSDEFVSPAKPDRAGVTIGRRGWDMELAVPPGYWLLRNEGGGFFNWHPDEFGVTWSRMDRPWTPATGREPTEGGWRGTEPAEGTRRHLIREVLGTESVRLGNGEGGFLSRDSSLELADAIEAALLDSTIGAEEQLAEKREELIELHRFLDDLGAPCGPEIPFPTVLRRLHALVARSGSFTIGEGSEWPLPPGEYEIRPVPREQDTAAATDEPDPDAPDAEIVDGEGHLLAGLHVVVGAQDGVPYLSLIELEHLFANLYEDITERQARKQRGEATVSGTQAANVGESPTEQTWPVGSPERRKIEAELAEAQRRDNADDRPLWRVEVDYALNHVRNAIASWMGL